MRFAIAHQAPLVSGLALAIVLAGGCASVTFKRGASPGAMTADESACGGRETADPAAFRQCMKERGWFVAGQSDESVTGDAVDTPAAEWLAQKREQSAAPLAAGAAAPTAALESATVAAEADAGTATEIAAGARFFGWELLCLGRPANHEKFTRGHLDQRLEIYRVGEPRLLDRLTCRDGLPAGMRGHAATAVLIASGASNAALDCARALCASASGALCAATVLDEFLICRGLAASIEPLLETWRALWSALRPLVLGRAAVPPRIWRT